MTGVPPAPATPTTAGVVLDCDPTRPTLGSVCTITLSYPDDERLEKVAWSFSDLAGNPVRVYEMGKEPKDYDGFVRNATIFDNQIQLKVSNVPLHAELRVRASATLSKQPDSSKPKTSRAAVADASINFEGFWGGMDRAHLPMPVDWVIPWGKDGPGRRALVLLYDLIIRQLPDEFRDRAGAVPIVRAVNLPAGIKGFHGPYISDAVVITDEVVTALDETEPGITPADINFASMVVHELAHVVTYRSAPVDIHGALIELQKLLRSARQELPGVPGLRLKPELLVLAGWHGLVASDFATGFAEAAGWELSSPLLRIDRLRTPYMFVDLANFLMRVPSKGWDALRIHPNMISGWAGVGMMYGLRNVAADRGAIEKLGPEEAQLYFAFYDATAALERERQGKNDPAEMAKLSAANDAARQAWQAKADALDAALRAGGMVSEYASVDVLEDIAETFRAMTFGADHLNEARPPTPDPYQSVRYTRRYVTTDDKGKPLPGFVTKRDYLVKEGVFPKRWQPIRVGGGMRGDDVTDHLDKWAVVP